MEETSGEHLSQEDFENLVLNATSGLPSSKDKDSNDASLTKALRHIETCDVCRNVANLNEAATRMLNQLKSRELAAPRADCPAESEWPMVVAGQVDSEKANEYLRHAAECDHCGKLMRETTEAFADDFTAEEERAISQLKSSDAIWQKQMARELSSNSPAQTETSAKVLRGRWLSFTKWQAWAYAAAAVILIGVILFPLASRYFSRTPDRLLAQAYGEQRNLELRFSGAEYGPVRVQRAKNGESRLAKSPSLLEAEALIARGLQKEPNSGAWLQAKGRADLLDGNYEAAIQSFEKALDVEPGSASLQTDAASAYFLRGELADRASDYGKAIELLGKILAKNPDDPIALFNRALVNEKMFLYRQAVEDWERYLRLDPKGDWANEANQHLNNLRQKLNEQKQSATEPLLGPAAFLKKINDPAEDLVKHRIEEYLDLAVREWLPTATRDAANTTVTREALSALALVLRNDHQDPWLADLISTPPSNSLSGATQALAAASGANASGDFETAEKSSIQAQRLFEESGSVAGRLRAQLETIYALDRSGDSKKCLLTSDLPASNTAKYRWLETQLFLERSNCLSQMGRFSESRRAIETSLALAADSGYSTLSLRALGIAAALHTDQGNAAVAGSLDREGLQRYWDGAHPPIRAYQFYSDLGFHAEKREQWNFALTLAKEAVGAISLSPQRLGEAFARHRLAKTAIKAGEQELAFAEFDRANDLFAALPQTEVTRTYQADGEIELARLETERGDVARSWAHLSTARAQLPKTTRYFTALNFYRTLGELHHLKGDRTEAEKAFHAALAVTERGLASLRDEQERSVWVRDTSEVYRALAQMRWESNDIEGALGLWEWYRGAAQRTAPVASVAAPASDSIDLAGLEAGTPVPATPPIHDLSYLADKTVLVYLQMPRALMIWVIDDRGVTGKQVPVSQDEIVRQGRRFVEECANPNSDLSNLQRNARRLYDLLVGPVAERLPALGTRTLVIEMDQAIANIPMSALLDPEERYLGASYDLVLSQGMVYRSSLSPPTVISPGQKALIVGSPALSGDLASSLEPLGDAVQEAEYVASKFKSSTLLTGSRATLDTIQRELPHSELFHFAGHALTPSEHVGLLLANSDSQSENDTAILNSKSIASLNLRGLQLAVFSACSTAKDASSGESNSESLVNLFLRGGVSQVLATRWNVDSRITARFMQIFYDNLLSGSSAIARNKWSLMAVGESYARSESPANVTGEAVIESLRVAGNQLRANPETQHPYYWAAFTVFGQ